MPPAASMKSPGRRAWRASWAGPRAPCSRPAARFRHRKCTRGCPEIVLATTCRCSRACVQHGKISCIMGIVRANVWSEITKHAVKCLRNVEGLRGRLHICIVLSDCCPTKEQTWPGFWHLFEVSMLSPFALYGHWVTPCWMSRDRISCTR